MASRKGINIGIPRYVMAVRYCIPVHMFVRYALEVCLR